MDPGDHEGPIKYNDDVYGTMKDYVDAGAPRNYHGKDKGDDHGEGEKYTVVINQGDGENRRNEQDDGDGSIKCQGDAVEFMKDHGDAGESRHDNSNVQGDSEEQEIKQGSRSGMVTRCCENNRRKQIEPPSAWLALIASFIIKILIAVADSTLGIFYDYYIDRYDANRATVGWMMSVYLLSGSIIGNNAECQLHIMAL